MSVSGGRVDVAVVVEVVLRLKGEQGREFFWWRTGEAYIIGGGLGGLPRQQGSEPVGWGTVSCEL